MNFEMAVRECSRILKLFKIKWKLSFFLIQHKTIVSSADHNQESTCHKRILSRINGNQPKLLPRHGPQRVPTWKEEPNWQSPQKPFWIQAPNQSPP